MLDSEALPRILTRRQPSGVLPPHYRRRSISAVSLFGLAVFLAGPRLFSTPADALLLNQWLILTLAGLGFYLIFSVSGQFALSQAFMMGLGGYASSWASETNGFWVGLAFAPVATIVVALLFSLAVRKASAFYFAVATLGLASIGLTLFEKLSDFTGPGGQRANVPAPRWFGRDLFTSEESFPLVLGFVLLGMVLVVFIERSGLRRTTVAVRDAETVSRTLGISVTRNRTVMFAVGSCYGAVAGTLMAHTTGFISPESFTTTLGIGIFLIVVLGGTGSMWGPVLGSAFYVFVPEELTFLQGYKEIFYGALLVTVMIVLPDGLVGIAQKASSIARRFARGDS